MGNRRRRRPNAVVGAVTGAAAGIVASWVMVRFNHMIAPADGRSDKAGDRHAHRRRTARPNDMDGTIPDEPGSMQAAAAIAEPIMRQPLTERQKEAGGSAFHYAFGAAAGALYGAAAEVDASTTRAAGMAYGVGVWLVADELGMHAAGFATSPTDYPLTRHASSLASHVVFGLTLEAVRRVLRGRR